MVNKKGNGKKWWHMIKRAHKFLGIDKNCKHVPSRDALTFSQMGNCVQKKENTDSGTQAKEASKVPFFSPSYFVYTFHKLYIDEETCSVIYLC